MMEVFASLLFASAFALSLSTIALMLSRYRHRMLAALLMEPMQSTLPLPAVKVDVRRRQVVRSQTRALQPARLVHAAA